MARTHSAADAWSRLTGYIALMVRDGSDDAVQILTYAHELQPATRLFTGTVEHLTGQRNAGPTAP